MSLLRPRPLVEVSVGGEPPPHTEECACCAYTESLGAYIDSLLIPAKLDALHRMWGRVEQQLEKIMTAQQDIDAAAAALKQLADAAPAIVAALGAASSPAAPVTTSALAADTSSATAALSQIAAALPAAPAAPVAASEPASEPVSEAPAAAVPASSPF